MSNKVRSTFTRGLFPLALLLALAGCHSPTIPYEPDLTPFDEECLKLGMLVPYHPGEPAPFDGTVSWEQYGTDGWVYPGCSASWDKVTGGRH